ncbi:MAG: AAA family ATPase [Acetobacter sp.]|nr:AAA family ATPase [Acetobacter sp.]
MNIVASGSMFQVYGDDVRTFKELPAESFEVNFNKMIGFYLTKRPDLVANEEKIYGDHERRAEKVMRSYALSERNFGIILSGQKGIGKSLLARVLAQKAIAAGMPVITVSIAVPGIANFLASIEQEVLIIFDEFEKTFGKHDDDDPQEELLSLFDGLDNGKKLFCITCNDPKKLNEFMINRPGRFHYHFSISNPSDEEVRQYMTDKLLPQYQNMIEKVVGFSQTIHMTYDYLRAIAFELNQGYSIEEILQDLNISRANDVNFDIQVELSNGEIYTAYSEQIDLYSDRLNRNIRMSDAKYKMFIYISLRGTDIHSKDGVLTIDADKVNWVYDYYQRYDDLSEEDEKALKAEDAKITVKAVQFIKRDVDFVKRYMV